jgi:hypothetical protein
LVEIISTLSRVEIDTSIAEIISSDPESSSKVIPYYRNNKHRIYSVFETYPDDLEIIQNINLYLIAQIPNASLVRLKYPQPGIKTDLKFSKLGKSTELNKLCSELIYLLRIREDIDYDNSSYKGYSKLASWLFKTVTHFKKNPDKSVIHVVLQPRDHTLIGDILKTESNTLVYRAFMQTINLLVMVASLPPTLSSLTKRISQLLGNEIPNLILRKNLSDTTNIEPYYIWTSITSPEERGVLTKKVGENFFNSQNKLLREFRSSKPTRAHEELVKLKAKVDAALPNGVKATLYGRLKFYNHLKKSDEVKKILDSSQGTKQLPIATTRSHSKKQGVLSLFAPENIIGTCYNVVNKPTELMDLTKLIKYNPDTDYIFYYKQDLESSLTYKHLVTRSQDGNSTLAENSLLASIESRAIQFVPGVDRRF